MHQIDITVTIKDGTREATRPLVNFIWDDLSSLNAQMFKITLNKIVANTVEDLRKNLMDYFQTKYSVEKENGK